MYNKDSIIERIIASPEGGTVIAGAAIDPMVTDGYFVGGNGKPFIAGNGVEFTPDMIFQLKQWLQCCAGEYVGWWTDSATGKLYVDGTDWFQTRGQAERAAFDRHEIAFWGVAEEAEFRFQYVQQ